MPREREAYRDILEDVLQYFGSKRLLTLADVSKYLGIDRRTAAKRFGITADGISAQALARKLAAL